MVFYESDEVSNSRDIGLKARDEIWAMAKPTGSGSFDGNEWVMAKCMT